MESDRPKKKKKRSGEGWKRRMEKRAAKSPFRWSLFKNEKRCLACGLCGCRTLPGRSDHHSGGCVSTRNEEVAEHWQFVAGICPSKALCVVKAHKDDYRRDGLVPEPVWPEL